MEKGRRDELAREKDALQGQVAELGGMVKSQERLLELEKVRSCLSVECGCVCQSSVAIRLRDCCAAVCIVICACRSNVSSCASNTTGLQDTA